MLAAGLAVLAWFWPSIHGCGQASVGARGLRLPLYRGPPAGPVPDDFEPGMGMVTISAMK
jgi:hypothetical protein